MWVTKQLTGMKTYYCQVAGSRWFLHSRHWCPEKCLIPHQFLGVLSATSIPTLPSSHDCTCRNHGLCSTCLPRSFLFSSLISLIHIRMLIKKPIQSVSCFFEVYRCFCPRFSTQIRQFICYTNKPD